MGSTKQAAIRLLLAKARALTSTVPAHATSAARAIFQLIDAGDKYGPPPPPILLTRLVEERAAAYGIPEALLWSLSYRVTGFDPAHRTDTSVGLLGAPLGGLRGVPGDYTATVEELEEGAEAMGRVRLGVEAGIHRVRVLWRGRGMADAVATYFAQARGDGATPLTSEVREDVQLVTADILYYLAHGAGEDAMDSLGVLLAQADA